MKITFILPAIGKKSGEKYIGTWKMEPLTIAVLKALTPAHVETSFYDDRIELIDYNAPTDLVVLTVETYTAKRSYFIADVFRRRGTPVVMGGYHVTLFPEEALEHADSIITGNGETVWTAMLQDMEGNRLKPHYQGGFGYTDTQPDKSIFSGKAYMPVSLLETGRGCCHACDFCAISSYYGSRYYPRSHQGILQDIEASSRKYHFFVDDNLMADVENARTLFQRVEPFNIKWAGQGTLSMAKDPELLKTMKRSGCELILIGFESLEEESLKQMNKSWKAVVAERDELVNRIHDAGIGIYATFIFGYDGDTPATFDRTLDFARKHRFYTTAFNHLLPFPGTALYDRLQQEDRLLHDKWWLAEDYSYGQVAFRPKNFTAEELSRLCRDARKSYASLPTVLSRGLAAMRRSSPYLWSLFWAMNLRLGTEVDEKMNVPLGRNLDEYPK